MFVVNSKTKGMHRLYNVYIIGVYKHMSLVLVGFFMYGVSLHFNLDLLIFYIKIFWIIDILHGQLGGNKISNTDKFFEIL